MFSVFIDGDQGTTGLRVRDRLAGREDISLLSLPEEKRKDLDARAVMARRADATILCLPDAASRELVAALGEEEGVILDASTAHRTDPRFTYGFPELGAAQAKAVSSARRIAVPGCHASGCIALVKPLIAAGLLSPDAPLSLLSLTGYSGGGKRMIADYEAPDRPANLHAPRPYAVGQSHKHLPEITHVCGLTRPPVFQPVVMDVFSGMLVSLPLTEGILSRRASLAEVSGAYRTFFEGAALVRVLEDNSEAVIDSVALSGSDRMELLVTGNDDRMIAYARFDNLGKGACGAAIECLNLVLGAPPLTGLAL